MNVMIDADPVGPFPPLAWYSHTSSMSHFEHRTLIQALALSVLVHAVLLLGVVTTVRLEPGVPAAAMKVVIAQKSRVEPVQHATVIPDPPRKDRASTPVPRPEPRKAPALPKRAARAESEVPRIAVQKALPVAAPATPVSTDTSSDSPTAPHVSAPEPVPMPVTNGKAAVGEASGANLGVNADELRRYRVSLASAARRFKRYPALAQEQGWEGTAEVAIRISSALPVPGAVLVRSSGHDLLDEQALQMMTQAARVTTLPEGLRARDLEIPLPVKFSLDETQ